MTIQEKKAKEYEGKNYRNNNKELMIIKHYFNSTLVTVYFPETKTETTTQMSNIKRGNVTNPIHGTGRPTIRVNKTKEILINSKGLEFKIIKQIGPKALVIFNETKTTKWVYTENALNGKVTDEYHTSVYNIGYQGNPDKNKEHWKEAAQLWRNMMKRCYSEKDKKGYDKTHMSKRWLSFENFLNDIDKIENFNLWIDKKNKMEIDKDILGNGEVYDREVCKFVTQKENRAEQQSRMK